MRACVTKKGSKIALKFHSENLDKINICVLSINSFWRVDHIYNVKRCIKNVFRKKLFNYLYYHIYIVSPNESVRNAHGICGWQHFEI